MQTLDLRSLIIIAGLMGMVMGVVLLAMRRDFPASIRGMLPWGLAPLTAAAATGIFAFPSTLPQIVSSPLGNGLLLAGMGLFYFGSQCFYEQRSTWRWWLGFGLAMMAGMLVFLVVWPDYRLRVLLFCVAAASVMGAHARLLWRLGRGLGPRFTAAVLTVHVAVLLVRGVSSLWLDTPATTPLTPSLVQTVYFTANSFAILFVALGHVLMASERVRREFEHLATHDGLTGALTRRAALDVLTHEAERWHRYGQPFSVLLLDIDHFKRVNDTHGHLTGDRVLADVTDTIQRALRTTDRLGRYGGEEFIVVLPETGLADAILAAERLRRALQARPPTSERPTCTASIGVATAIDGENPEALLARADVALYRAKAAGRNRVMWDEREGAVSAPPQPATSAV